MYVCMYVPRYVYRTYSNKSIIYALACLLASCCCCSSLMNCFRRRRRFHFHFHFCYSNHRLSCCWSCRHHYYRHHHCCYHHCCYCSEGYCYRSKMRHCLHRPIPAPVCPSHLIALHHLIPSLFPLFLLQHRSPNRPSPLPYQEGHRG